MMSKKQKKRGINCGAGGISAAVECGTGEYKENKLITKFTHIKGHRIWRDFKWDDKNQSLSGVEFKKYNVIYGRNGSGKTTLSSLFEMMKNGACSGADFSIQLTGGENISSADITDNNTPDFKSLRVLNSSILHKMTHSFQVGGEFVHVIGQNSVDNHISMGNINDEIFRISSSIHLTVDTLTQIDAIYNVNCLLAFNRIQSRVKELGLPFERFDVERVRDDYAAYLLQQELSFSGGYKDKIQRIEKPPNCLYMYLTEIAAKSDALLASAIADGSAERVLLDVDELIRRVNLCRQELSSVSLPKDALLYEGVKGEHMRECINYLRKANEDMKHWLTDLWRCLNSKKLRPESPVEFIQERNITELSANLDFRIHILNHEISLHNAFSIKSRELSDGLSDPAIDDIVNDCFSEFDNYTNTCLHSTALFVSQIREIECLREKYCEISAIKNANAETARYLTHGMRMYLGYSDLEFDISTHSDGYVVRRNGDKAANLSEAEGGWAALLCFLRDASHDDDCTMIVDDPVSSMDSLGVMFAAHRITDIAKNCKQVFIMTHNIGFFREVKEKMRNKSVAYFIVDNAVNSENDRTAYLDVMPSMLKDFSNEYVYYFYQIHVASNIHAHVPSIGDYQILNIARKFLEMFVLRVCLKPGSVWQALNGLENNNGDIIVLDEVRCLLEPLLNTYSHGLADMEEHMYSIIKDIPRVMNAVLSVVERADNLHYKYLRDAAGIDGGVS